MRLRNAAAATLFSLVMGSPVAAQELAPVPQYFTLDDWTKPPSIKPFLLGPLGSEIPTDGYINAITGIKRNGKQLLTTIDAYRLWKMNADSADVSAVAEFKRNGAYLFSGDNAASDNIVYFFEKDGTREFAESMLDILAWRQDLECGGRDLIQYAEWSGSSEYAESASQLKNDKGGFVFQNCRQILRHQASPAMLTDAVKLSSAGFSGTEIYLLPKLGVGFDEYRSFTDTPMPNAVVVYPEDDYNGVFETEDAIGFLENLRARYDVKVVVAGNMERVYDALKATPDISLLVLNGHGDDSSLTLRESPGAKLEAKDAGLLFTGNLRPDAVVFMNSCSTAKGGREKRNLANFIAELTGLTVIAPLDELAPRYNQVLSWVPFDVCLNNEVGESAGSGKVLLPNDVTYKRVGGELSFPEQHAYK